MKRFAKQMKAGSRTAGMRTRLDRTERELVEHLKAIRYRASAIAACVPPAESEVKGLRICLCILLTLYSGKAESLLMQQLIAQMLGLDEVCSIATPHCGLDPAASQAGAV